MLSIADIIRRERHDPPMTDEERQRAMDFILAQQAKNSVEIERLIASHDKAEHRFDRDERRGSITYGASIAHTDKRLDALIDIVRNGLKR